MFSLAPWVGLGYEYVLGSQLLWRLVPGEPSLFKRRSFTAGLTGNQPPHSMPHPATQYATSKLISIFQRQAIRSAIEVPVEGRPEERMTSF